MRVKWIISLVSLSLILAGCVSADWAISVDIMHLEWSTRIAKDPSAVKIFLGKPPYNYRTIAVVQLTAGMVASLDNIRSRMVAEAARLGGDGVIFHQLQDKAVGGLISSGAYLPLYNTRAVGEVIVFE